MNFVVLDADIFAQECILKSKFFRCEEIWHVMRKEFVEIEQ